VADEALTAGAVARRLGVAVTTLRTWHQRYGLGPSHHVPGQHRRYTPEDLERLQVMRRLTVQGVTPAEAAAWARRVPIPPDIAEASAGNIGAEPARRGETEARASPGISEGDGAPRDPNGSGGPPGSRDSTGSGDPARAGDHAGPGDHAGAGGHARAGYSAASGGHSGPSGPAEAGDSFGPGDLGGTPAAGSRGRSGTATGDEGAPVFTRPGAPRRMAVDSAWPEEIGPVRGARDGGGRAIRTGRAGPAARGLARAAMRLDAPALRDILEMTIADRGVIAAWEEVIMPVLIGIGERYAATKRFIEVEHLISRGITEVLASVARPPSRQVARVLLAAADEEQHTLPLEALAAALAQAGVASRLLGARVPAQALSDAVARTGPAAVVVWSQLPGSGDPEQLRLLLAGPHQPLLTAVAGPGWNAEELPEGVTMLWSLQEAVHLVTAAATPVGPPS
jgi:DNA-binding transcriptional MerR regulator